MPAPANLALFVTGGYMDVLLAVIDTIVDATSTIENANNIDNSSSSQQSSTDVESSNVSILSVDQLQHLIQRNCYLISLMKYYFHSRYVCESSIGLYWSDTIAVIL